MQARLRPGAAAALGPPRGPSLCSKPSGAIDDVVGSVQRRCAELADMGGVGGRAGRPYRARSVPTPSIPSEMLGVSVAQEGGHLGVLARY